MERLGATNSCRLGADQNYITNLGSLTSVGVPDLFLLWSCHMCFYYIIQKELPEKTLDYTNDTQMEEACLRTSISISFSRCIERVKDCCVNARNCCLKQIKQRTDFSNLSCPMTWDGISCVDQTPANVTTKLICPTYVPYFLGDMLGEKKCLGDGNWFTKTENNVTWERTDYDKCYNPLVDIESLSAQIKAAILILSIIMLIVSLSIFVVFKSLRSQQRIKIHINLFFTLLLKSAFELMNTVLFAMHVYSRIKSSILNEHNLLNQEACKWITILLRYFQNSTFCWMLCEALFLYQLLFRTFEHISSIKIYLFIGWGLPFVYTLIYVLIRKFLPSLNEMDKECWVEELPKMEYLMRGPNIIVMLINVVLLINILSLIRNLPAQPTDRSYWKRTLKAVLILVPLFGLQFILVAFQLESTNRYFLTYLIIQNFIQDSQGIAVSLAFCAINKEVYTNIKQTFAFGRCSSHVSLPRSHSTNRYSNSSRSSDHFKMIPLIKSQEAAVIRRSADERKVKEILKKNNKH